MLQSIENGTLLKEQLAAQLRGAIIDLAFHLSLARCSRNSLLLEMLERLLSPLFTFVMLRVRKTDETNASWAPDLLRYAQIIYMMEHSGRNRRPIRRGLCPSVQVVSRCGVVAGRTTKRKKTTADKRQIGTVTSIALINGAAGSRFLSK